jgi:protease I
MSKRVLILATDGFEQSELIEPKKALEQAGIETVVASPQRGEIKGWNHSNWGERVAVDAGLEEVAAADFDALLLPGGVMNPDKLRVNDDAMKLVKAFLASGKPVAAICHGPWLLVQADALKGRRATSYKSIRKDVENAGATWVDEKVVVDDGIITSRSPEDIDAFVKKIVEEVGEGRHYQRAA